MRRINSPSAYWRTVKNLDNPNQNQKFQLNENGTLIEDEKQLSDIMCKFYKVKVEDIDKEIPNLDISPLEKLEEKLQGRNLKFSLKTVRENQVTKAIKSLKGKSSSGIDFISPQVIKMSVDIITTPLCHIINSSISEGVFPNSWKVGKIIPIYKNKGSKLDKKNYRPVSLLRSASKVLELIVNQQVLRYFETQNLLSKTQHGFRPSRSCFTAIAQMHDEWIKNYKAGRSSIVTCFDLSAAFDTMSKDIFVSKLKLYGFDQRSRDWFSSYLEERKQVVMIGATLSEETTINIGSPQGAILSPTCFIILISDIELWTDSKIHGYADDTTSTISGENMEELVKKCENEAQKILDYMAINRLKANDDKTAILIMRRNHSDAQSATRNEGKQVIKIGKENIKEKDKEKLLGVIVSNDLKWDKHIKELIRKLKYRMFKLKRLKGKLPNHLLKRVADGIYMSQIRYALPLYCPVQVGDEDPKPVNIEKLRKTFNDCLRLLTGHTLEDHKPIKEMLEELDWLSINQLAVETRLTEAWKSANFENYCMKDNLKARPRGAYNTRNNQEVYFYHSEDGRLTSFANKTAQIWNKAPKAIKEA